MRTKSHNNILNYILAILLVFLSSGTVPIFQEPIALVIVSGFVGFVFSKHSFGSSYYSFIGLAILFSLGYLVQFQTFNPMFSLWNILVVTISYMIVRILGWSLILYLEDIIYKLSVLSLVIFTWQLINFSSAFEVLSAIEKTIPFGEFGGERNAGIVVYVIKDYAEFRNSGFAWEPGAFAAFLSFPIFFNLIMSNFRLNRRSVVMLIALITTISTMGYIVLVSLIIFYYINVQHQSRNRSLTALIGGVVVISVSVIIFQQEFMTEKVISEVTNVNVIIDNSHKDVGSKKEIYSLGRIASLKVDFQDFLKYPIFGFGGQDEAITLSNQYTLNRNNGWGKYLRTFGIIGVIILLINLNNTGLYLQTILKKKNVKLFFIVIFLIFTFSNGIIMSPLMISYQWFGTQRNRRILTKHI